MGNSFVSGLTQCLGAVPWGSVPWGSIATFGFNEYSVLANHNDDLLSLNNNFDLIEATLEDALKNNNAVDKYNEVLLKQLRSLALEVENVLDEVSTAAKLQRLPRDITYRVIDFFPVTINTICFIHKVKGLNSKVDEIAKKFNGFQLESDPSGHDMSYRETMSIIDYTVEQSKIRSAETEMIIKKICNKDIGKDNDGEIPVYGIWGMGGIGKTTLAQLVYNHTDVGKQFNLKCWVHVSENFQVKETMKKIIGSKCTLEHLDDVQKTLQEKLQGSKFLIVLDDVWIENDENENRGWRDLVNILRCGGEGSVVLMTTRSKKTSHMLAKAEDLQHELKGLSLEASWKLFKTHAFEKGKTGAGLSELEHIGKEIVNKCQGLPLALNVLGKLMWSKDTRSQWEDVNATITYDLHDRNVLNILKLSYYNLLPHLKRCFAYCCLFPKGYPMEKDVVIQLWVANGFIPQRGEISLYVLGEEVFKCLVWRCFFQVVERIISNTSTIERYKMHDLMYDIARDVMGDDCMVIEAACKEVKIPNTEVLHLSSSCQDLYSPDHDLQNLTSLRSMLMFEEINEFTIKQILKHVYLRVLYLYNIKVSLPKSICSLQHLRYLNISYSDIDELPESIIYLQNLQVLILYFCTKLIKLPEGLGLITSLQYLDIRHCVSLHFLPVGIKELTSLRMLTKFPVGWKTMAKLGEPGANIGELGDLNLLEGELEILKLGNVGGKSEAESANLKCKRNISGLKLSWEYSGINQHEHEQVLEGLEPNPSLKKLVIDHHCGKTISPSWMVKLRDLVEINFECCWSCEHIPALGKLPNLRVISLSQLESLKSFHDDDDTNTTNMFPSLQELHIDECDELVSLPRNLPKLKVLSLKNCQELKPSSLPTEIFDDLETLYIYNCEHLRDIERTHGPNIARIPDLNISRA